MHDLLPICHQCPHLSLENSPGRSFSVHYRHCGLMRLLQQLFLFPDLPSENRENALRFSKYAAIPHVGLPCRSREDNNKGPDPGIFKGQDLLFFSGMKSAGENHPCEKILICRDEISRGESSLREIFICRDEISEEESSLREDFYLQR